MKDIAAVVVTHNSQKTITACLMSLARQGVDTVVVDTASSDETNTVVQAHSPRRYLQVENNGFSQAANIGAGKAEDAKYLLFLNPDAEVEGLLEDAVAFLDESPNVAVLGLGLQQQDGSPEVDAYGKQPTLLAVVTRKYAQPTSQSKIHYPDWVSGGAVIIRAEVFFELQGFDERFFMYWEDVDFCTRARKAGYSVARMPQIIVVHERGHSLQDKDKKTKLYDISADRYFQKHYASPIWIFHRLLRYIYRLVSQRVR